MPRQTLTKESAHEALLFARRLLAGARTSCSTKSALIHDAERVDLKAKTTENGGDYLAINPKGAVPALELDSGEVLTENAVILQYLGDRSSVGEVLPPLGNFRRYRVLELVNFITTELHKRFGFLFSPDATDEMKQLVIRDLGKKLDYIDAELGEGPFLMGDELTLPDPYLFVITGWTDKMLGARSLAQPQRVPRADDGAPVGSPRDAVRRIASKRNPRARAPAQ